MTFFKLILITASIFLFHSCKYFSENRALGEDLFVLSKSTSITMVMNNKIPFSKSLPEIIDSCNSGGEKWRLPTVEELDKMYSLQKKGVRVFGDCVFLSDDIGAHDASVIDFKNGKWGYDSQYDEVYLLLVKDTIVVE